MSTFTKPGRRRRNKVAVDDYLTSHGCLICGTQDSTLWPPKGWNLRGHRELIKKRAQGSPLERINHLLTSCLIVCKHCRVKLLLLTQAGHVFSASEECGAWLKQYETIVNKILPRIRAAQAGNSIETEIAIRFPILQQGKINDITIFRIQLFGINTRQDWKQWKLGLLENLGGTYGHNRITITPAYGDDITDRSRQEPRKIDQADILVRGRNE